MSHCLQAASNAKFSTGESERVAVFWGNLVVGKKMCSGGNGVGGIGGKGLVRDQLGLIGQVAAAAAPRLVTAAVPHDLRVDPCEKKSKETSLGA